MTTEEDRSQTRRRNPQINLNLNVRGLPNSSTLAIQERCRELVAKGRQVVRLGLGQSPFPVPECVVQALRENAHQKDYLPVRGLTELRAAVADHHRVTLGLDCTGEDVLVGPGSKELMFLLQLVYYGDIVIPTPAWVSYAPQANIIGRKVVFVPTREEDSWGLTADRLEELCEEDRGRPRILVLNYPSNPTGRTYDSDHLKAIARVARKHRVVVLSDEIYGRLHHEGKHESIATLYPEGTIVSNGMSKWCGAGGWRLGVFVFPRKMRWMLDTMSSVASETYTSTAAPIQFAAVRAFHGGEEIERYLESARKVLRALGRNLAARLRKADIRVLEPQGAFYLFPNFSRYREALERRGIGTSRELCESLLEDTGVALLPGDEFGRPERELSARLAYVDFDGAAALRDVSGIEGEPSTAFLDQRCGTVLHAVERITSWIKKQGDQ